MCIAIHIVFIWFLDFSLPALCTAQLWLYKCVLVKWAIEWQYSSYIVLDFCMHLFTNTFSNTVQKYWGRRYPSDPKASRHLRPGPLGQWERWGRWWLCISREEVSPPSRAPDLKSLLHSEGCWCAAVARLVNDTVNYANSNTENKKLLQTCLPLTKRTTL